MTSRSATSYLSPIPELIKIKLLNGAELYPVRRGTVPVIKLELMYPAGRPYEKKNGLASATLQLMKGGTQKRSATRLAEGFDLWGSSLNFDFYVDNCGIKLFVLEKYLPKVLPLFCELITVPSFPVSELKLYQRQQKEKLRSDESRGDVIAYRAFTEQLFGSNHPYGYNSTIASIDDITRDDLFHHFDHHYNIRDCKIFLSGSYSDDTLTMVQETMESLPISGIKKHKLKVKPASNASGHLHLPREDAVQSSIRIGRRMFTRNHPDYVAMYVLNTILGGYYGSRLMQNLREKKGLTYSIYSSLDTFLLDGYFLISTEVDKSRKDLAIKETNRELSRLQVKKISKSELSTIKSYLRGSFLNYFENVLAQSELIRLLTIEGGVEGYLQLLQGIEDITVDDLNRVALKYLNADDLSLITVG